MTTPTDAAARAMEACERIDRDIEQYYKHGQTVLVLQSDYQEIKTALQQSAPVAAGEPVAWQVFNPLTKSWTSAYADKAKADNLIEDGYSVRPLYSTPPRTGDDDVSGHLTIDEIAHRLDESWHDEFLDWYKPDQWLSSRRAASAFIYKKIMEREKPTPPRTVDLDVEAIKREAKRQIHALAEARRSNPRYYPMAPALINNLVEGAEIAIDHLHAQYEFVKRKGE